MTDPAPETLELLERAQAGDEDALGRLLERHAPRVLRVIRLRLGRPLREVVESVDILQEALLAAFRDFDRFELREDAAFLDWISRIAENRIRRAAEHHRAERRDHRRRVSGEHEAGGEELRWEPAAGETAAATYLAREEERGAVEEALARLPEAQRELIVAREYLGASWEEVARQTGHPSANAARLAGLRAKRRLGSLLREAGVAGEL